MIGTCDICDKCDDFYQNKLTKIKKSWTNKQN